MSLALSEITKTGFVVTDPCNDVHNNLPTYSKLVFKTLYLLTFIKLPFVIKIFVLSIFEWPFHTGFTVMTNNQVSKCDFKVI